MLSSSHKFGKEDYIYVLQKIATYINTCEVFLFCGIVE